MGEQLFIEILSAKHGISIRGLHLKHTTTYLQNGHIKSTTTQIKYYNCLSVFLVHSIRQRSGSGLINDSQDIQSSNLSCILSCLTLAVVEICGYCHHSLAYCATEEAFRSLLHLSEDHGTYLRRAVFLSTRSNPCIIIVG
mmetsp:Transcript_13681/g.20890  ORF Transcript_13681/g.20890 Transcript_13681/m.20890 type:complete len:140 (+) Transcript_13681:207-626(+)